MITGILNIKTGENDIKIALNAKVKQKELLNKSDISNLTKKYDVNTKLAALATKAELKGEQDKILKLQTRKLKTKTNFFWVMMVHKICLFTSQYLVRYN